MEAVLIVGNTGRGKSTTARKLVEIAKKEKREILIYDPNAEWKDFYSGKFENKKDFLNRCANKKGAFILFEESTIFFSNRGNEEQLIDLLVRKRHANNKIVMNFHSLRSLPKYIIELCNYMVLYKTADTPEFIINKLDGFDEIIECYNQLLDIPDDNRTNFHANFVIEINKPVHLV